MLRRIPLLVWFLLPTFVLVGAGVWFLSKSQTVPENQVLGEAAGVSKPVEGTVDYTIVGGDNLKKEIIEKDSWKVVLEPREQNDSKIALVAWGRVLVMDQPDYDKIEAFIKTY